MAYLPCLLFIILRGQHLEIRLEYPEREIIWIYTLRSIVKYRHQYIFNGCLQVDRKRVNLASHC